jgi:hypothetical protein
MIQEGCKMNNHCYNAEISMHEYKKTFTYNNTDMLKLTIIYPQISLNASQAEYKNNSQINMEVNDYKRYAKYLYKQAIKDYIRSLNEGFHFWGYEAFLEYFITYNQNCFLSLYFDKYEFTGGAHGSTLRASDTWELCLGHHLPLGSFFKPGTDYKRILTDEIIRQADQIQERQKIYFDDYKPLIIKNFDKSSFYLSPEGITIYYQQYDIAPYSSGIAEFTIPYSIIGWRPDC